MTLLGGATAAAAASCFAQTAAPPFWGVDDFQAKPEPYWRGVAERDVEAARKLLAENHPGAVPAVGDRAFTDSLARAYAIAKSRAHKVTSYQGYTATLAAFATAMGDKHIRSRPTFIVAQPKWAGIAISWRPSGYFVTDAYGPELAKIMGSKLVECDGRPAEQLARTNVGEFRAQWSIEAQRAQATPLLFVDDGNPFIQRPERCSFDKDGTRVHVTLTWRRWGQNDLAARLSKAVGSGSAGFGVRRLGDGYWISLQQLFGPAREVVDAVKGQSADIQKASFAVLDLRGNGGGSSGFGDEIVRALMGEERVSAAQGGTESCAAESSWRASPGNLEQSRLLLRTLGETNGPDFRKTFEAAIEKMETAMREHRALTGPAACKSTSGPPVPINLPKSKMNGPLIFITDKKCFSSCLVVVNQLRHLDAFQVGQTTDANTHYMEVRDQYLPSGYSTFSTLQAVDPTSPLLYGPFAPDLVYDGDIADTAALEKWVVSVALPAASMRRPPPS